MFRITICLVVSAVASQSQAQIQDISPPELLNIWVDPTPIDCSLSDQGVTVRWEVTDDLVGVEYIYTKFRSPVPDQSRSVWGSAGNLISGNLLHGTYESILVVPRYSALGEWQVQYVTVEDFLDNKSGISGDDLVAIGMDVSFTVASTPEPTTLALLCMGVLGLFGYGWRRRG